jgi:hypothetical protein
MKEKLIRIWNTFDAFCAKLAWVLVLLIIIVVAALLQYNYQKQVVKDAIEESNHERYESGRN